jgi:hypothetical protein
MTLGLHHESGTVRVRGARFRIDPQDHSPIHAHGRAMQRQSLSFSYGLTVRSFWRIVMMRLFQATRSAVTCIGSWTLHETAFDAIAAEWERMQGEEK